MHLHQFVIKVASRCNLRCSYCYVYEKADQSWKQQPFCMSPEIAALAAERIAEHCCGKVERVSIVLHGGEPLLLGPPRLEQLVDIFRSALSRAGLRTRFVLQTNGVLLDQNWVELLYRLQITVGISLDGPAAHHDRFRTTRRGTGSHAQVERAVRLLTTTAPGQAIFGGTLSVIDPQLPPQEIYTYLRSLGVRNLHFLLPEHNYDDPPPAENYGQYLIDLFDCWLNEGEPTVRIELFETLVQLFNGQRFAWGHEFWGLEPLSLAVIETDGSIEPPDYLRACANGHNRLGLSVRTDPIARLLQEPAMAPLLERRAHLPGVCRSCAWLEICGGSALAHRYRQGSFDQPSVYCRDLQILMEHVGYVLAVFQMQQSPQPSPTLA